MIGKNVTKYREELSISQRELARRVGISGQMVSKIENDLTNPSMDTLSKIADVLECTIFDLTMDPEKLQKDVKIIESADHIIELAKKCGITMIDEYDDDGDGEYLRYVHISFSDKEFRLRGTEFYKLSERVLDSIITNVLAAENYDLLK